MSGSGQKGPLFFQFKSGRPTSWFSLLMLLVAGVFLFMFGIWLLLIVATILVLLLPYLWWKKRKFIRQVKAQMDRYEQQQQQASGQPTDINPPTSRSQKPEQSGGLVIEGQVLQKRQQDE